MCVETGLSGEVMGKQIYLSRVIHDIGQTNPGWVSEKRPFVSVCVCERETFIFQNKP